MGTIYLVRHGQASFGAAEYDRLSEVGEAQARALGAALRARLPVVDAVIAGTMQRHRQTAEGCLAVMGAALPIQALRGFDEYDHEEVLTRLDARYADRAALVADLAQEADPLRAFQALFTRAVARWTGGAHDAEYTEAWPAFKARCVGALDALVASLGRSKTALVFTSGGPISVIAEALLRLEAPLTLQASLVNAGVTKLIYGARGASLASLNEHGWLEAEPGLLTYR